MTPDPLLYETPLPYRRTFYPMGFGATIVTNSETIVAAAESVWGRFTSRRNAPPIELRLAVSDSSAGERPGARLPRGQGHLVSMIHDAENFAVVDLRSGFAFGWLTKAVACDPAYVRYHFIESCVYLLLESLYVTAAHAACVALNGHGVLLSGDCGAGKTTLAYACAKRGWTYLCDDSANLIRHSSDRLVVGNPYQIRFRPQAAALFPELAGNVPFDRPNGKPSIEVDTASLNLAITQQVRAEYLVFLKRVQDAPQRLGRYTKEEAYARLVTTVCYGEESSREERRADLRRLLTAPIYEMQYHELDWAEQRLRSLVENGE